MKKIVFCFTLLFGLNAVAATADVDVSIDDFTQIPSNEGKESSKTTYDDSSMGLDELFDDGQPLPKSQSAPTDYSYLNVDENSEENKYQELTNAVSPVNLDRGSLKHLWESLNDALDKVYDQKLSPSQRLENINIARATTNVYLDQLTQLIKSVNRLRIKAEEYVKILKAIQSVIENKTDEALKNEEHDLATEVRKTVSPYQKEQKTPKPPLNIEQIRLIYNDLEAFRQALSNRGTPVDTLADLGTKVCGDSDGSKIESLIQGVFNPYLYNLDKNKTYTGILIQIGEHLKQLKGKWIIWAELDPNSSDYIIDSNGLKTIIAKINRLIRKMIPDLFAQSSKQVLIGDIVACLADFEELSKYLQTTNVRYNPLKRLADRCFYDNGLAKLVKESSMSDESSTSWNTECMPLFKELKDIWQTTKEAQNNDNAPAKTKKDALQIRADELSNALVKFMQKFLEWIRLLKKDIAHPNH